MKIQTPRSHTPRGNTFFAAPAAHLIAIVLLAFPLTTSAWQLTNIRQLTNDGQSIAGSFSPQDQQLIAFSRPKYQGVFLLRWEQADRQLRQRGNVLQLDDAKQSGFQFQWLPSGDAIVARRAIAETTQQIVLLDIQQGLQPLSAPSEQLSVPVVGDTGIAYTDAQQAVQQQSQHSRWRQRELNLPYEQDSKIIWNQQTISPPLTQCWLPQLAPNQQQVVFECWIGMFVYVLDTQRLISLGKGVAPRWSADSQWLVFEDSKDNGTQVTQAEVVMVKADGSSRTVLTEDWAGLARRPALSADGEYVLFDDGKNVFLGHLVD